MTEAGAVEKGDRITVVIGGKPVTVRATTVRDDDVDWESVGMSFHGGAVSRECGTIRREQWERAAKAQMAVASSKETGPHDLQEMEKYHTALRRIREIATGGGLVLMDRERLESIAIIVDELMPESVPC